MGRTVTPGMFCSDEHAAVSSCGKRLFVRDPFTDRQLKTFKDYIRKVMDGVTNLVATIDGVSVLQPTRVTSPAFVITLP